MIKLALVGTGKWGKNILATLERLPDVSVRYVADTSGVRLYGMSRNDNTSVRRAPTLAKLANPLLVDGVIVATPGATHAKIALPFVQKSIPTFIEKPMTTSLTDALKLQRAAIRSKGIVMIGHIHLYNPAYQRARTLSKKGGSIRTLLFEGMNNGPYRNDMSALWDWAPHDISMALDILGTKPLAVQAWGENILHSRSDLHDNAMVRLLFSPTKKNGSVIPVHVNVSRLFPEKRKRLTIIGSRDTIVYDDTAEKKVTLFKNMGPQKNSAGARIKRHEPVVSHPSYDPTAPLTLELMAFVNAIRRGKQPPTDLMEGMRVMSIIAAAEKSLRHGGKIIYFNRA